MNRNKLKQYAPRARRDFIAAVTDRAAYYGLTKKYIQPIIEQGDVALISGKPFLRHVAEKRQRLEKHIKQQSFDHVMEAMAYTWFNRLVAIRFMELHGYLDHGYRVLSHPEGKPMPEILEHAEHVDLPGLKKETVIDLKLAGNKEGELYRLLLTAQCNALHTAMPFLFEKIDDETELLLPDNLLHSDSLIRRLVREIDEQDWQEVEIIGWLYQFYISEKKDQVIGKVVASEDIPAPTQLFTPNWIVKYLVQNTLGRQWLATYPQSTLRQRMAYYIEPAEQTPEVQEQLKTITPTSLNPEELTLLDPACGSGHILVEAYDLFKAIYQERGYRARDIPALILQKNLFGLEIDDRAAQLAAFALMMKARADDRRIFDSEAKPNILAFQDSRGMDAADITHALNAPINKEDVPSEYLFEEIEEEKAGLFSRKALDEKGYISQAVIASLLALFENAKTFGSLIQIPPELAAKLPEIEKRLDDVLKHGDLTHATAHVIKPLLQQARLLSRQYDAVVANPPYMSGSFFNDELKSYIRGTFKGYESDVFSSFISRCRSGMVTDTGYCGFMTPYTWMFISSHLLMRKMLIDDATLSSLIQLEYSVFDGATVPICAFTFLKTHIHGCIGSFIRLSSFKGLDQQPTRTLQAIRDEQCGWRYSAMPDSFNTIPGSPIAYWATEGVRKTFAEAVSLDSFCRTKKGLVTLNNARFMRCWHEVSISDFCYWATSRDEACHSGKKWFPITSGGWFRKWYGNNYMCVKWEADGKEVKAYIVERYGGGAFSKEVRSEEFYFRPEVTLGKITSKLASFRVAESSVVGDAGPCLFMEDQLHSRVIGFLNSKVAEYLLQILCPTLNFTLGELGKLPYVRDDKNLSLGPDRMIAIAKRDWNSNETSIGFQASPLQCDSQKADSLELSWGAMACDFDLLHREMRRMEEENNRLFIKAYGLQDELSPEVPDDQITLYRPERAEDIKGCIT